MKNFLFALLCVFCLVVPCTNVGAQAIVYSEGFESGTTPTGWTSPERLRALLIGILMVVSNVLYN